MQDSEYWDLLPSSLQTKSEIQLETFVGSKGFEPMASCLSSMRSLPAEAPIILRSEGR